MLDVKIILNEVEFIEMIELQSWPIRDWFVLN